MRPARWMTGCRVATRRGLLLSAAALAMLVASAPSRSASEATADGAALPRLVRVEPPRDSGHHLGDVVTYRALVAWPSGWQVDLADPPIPSREDSPVEWRDHHVESAEAECADCHWVSLRWQIFKTVHITSDVPLPALQLRMRRDEQVHTVGLPGSRLAVSPLVPWERRVDWINSARPGWHALPYDVQAHWAASGAWLLAAALALVGWAVISGHCLPRRAKRPFATAWRQVKAHARRRAPEAPATVDDLRCWHRAFDETAGETIFAEDLDQFFARHAHLDPIAGEARRIFLASRQHLYGHPPADTDSAPRLTRAELLRVLRQLVALEFRLSGRLQYVPPTRRPADASV